MSLHPDIFVMIFVIIIVFLCFPVNPSGYGNQALLCGVPLALLCGVALGDHGLAIHRLH